MQRPGSEHIDAAHRVLRYILGNLCAGLTYHGSGAVLGKSCGHLNKLTGAFDAGFSHSGAKATSGVAVLLKAGGNRFKADVKGLLFDAARGTVTFVDAATPLEAAPGGNEPADSDEDLSDAEEGVEPTSSDDESDTGGKQLEPAVPKHAV